MHLRDQLMSSYPVISIISFHLQMPALPELYSQHLRISKCSFSDYLVNSSLLFILNPIWRMSEFLFSNFQFVPFQKAFIQIEWWVAKFHAYHHLIIESHFHNYHLLLQFYFLWINNVKYLQIYLIFLQDF